MTIQGALFMGISWLIIISLAVFCFHRIFTRKKLK